MSSLVISVLLGLLTAFSALARGAHDIWAATAVYIATFLLFALMWIMRLREKEPLRYDFALPLALVIAAFALSSAQAINPGEAYLARMDIITAALLFFIAMNIFQADENMLPFLMVVIPVVLLQFVTILFQLNLAGTLVNPNIQAGFFLIWVPVLSRLSTVAKQENSGWAWFWKAGLIACVSGVVILRTLSGLAALLVLSMFLFPMLRRSWRALLGSVTLTLSILLFVKLKTVSPVARWDWWVSGIHMWIIHPWLGVGPGNFPSAYLAFKVGELEHTLFAHNSFVALLAETGLIGTAAVFFFLISLARRVWTERKRVMSRLPVIAAVVAVLAYSLINVHFEYLVNLMVLAIFLGIIAAPVARLTFFPPRVTAVAVAALALGVVPYLISPFLASQDVVSGRTEFVNGNLIQAQRAFESAARLDPRSWEAEEGLAATQFALYKAQPRPELLSEAIAHQERAIQRNYLAAPLWWIKGRYLREAGRNAEALDCFRKAALYHRSNAQYQKDVSDLASFLQEAA